MSESSFTGPSKTTGSKHRLSLLSSKQAGIRLKSEDQTDPQITILTASTQENFKNLVDLKSSENDHQVELKKTESHGLTSAKKSQEPINDDTQNAEQNRMNISREDLIRLLSLLKSELQSKEIALAAIKCEQLKRLINPIEISRSSLANTYIQLQDRFKILDQNNNNSNNSTAHHSSASNADNSSNGKLSIPERQGNKLQNEDVERESLNILNTLLELLDRHPLLALPRDSIYCLDYNCNELSTKNYLNLKIQHLDNLINQHRRFRYHMNERLKRSEQRFLDLTREYELERNLREENEKAMYKASGKAILLKHISQLKDSIEKEKRDKQAIVMTLLNELLDERERSESLARKLLEKESASAKLASKDRLADKEKLLKLETENNTLSSQLKKQALVFSREKNELKTKISDLEVENSNLKLKLEQQEKRLASPMKSAIGTIDAKESNQVSVSPTQTRTNPVVSKQFSMTGKQVSVNSNTSATVTRSSVAPFTSKPSSPTKSNSNPNSNSSASSSSNAPLGSRNSAQNISINGVTQSAQLSRQPATPSTTQRTPISSLTSKTNSSNTEHAVVRVQPLFKSASVLSTNQQVRNLKTSVSHAGTSSTSTPPRTIPNNQPLTKPMVPAKPAQLLDQQRSSFN